MSPLNEHQEHQQGDASHQIRVEQRHRQALQVWASALLPLPARTAFDLITHPENEQIFRHLDACTHHEVLHEDAAAGRRLVESEHVASWSLLVLRGTLKTRLRVEQDFRSLRSDFSLLPAGRFAPLRTFGGRWSVEAQPPEACAHLQRGGPGGGACCLLTLEQELQPAVPLPPPLGGVLRQLACRQVAGIFADLQREASRINSGRPTLAVGKVWAAGGGGASAVG